MQLSGVVGMYKPISSQLRAVRSISEHSEFAHNNRINIHTYSLVTQIDSRNIYFDEKFWYIGQTVVKLYAIQLLIILTTT